MLSTQVKQTNSVWPEVMVLDEAITVKGNKLFHYSALIIHCKWDITLNSLTTHSTQPISPPVTDRKGCKLRSHYQHTLSRAVVEHPTMDRVYVCAWLCVSVSNFWFCDQYRWEEEWFLLKEQRKKRLLLFWNYYCHRKERKPPQSIYRSSSVISPSQGLLPQETQCMLGPGKEVQAGEVWGRGPVIIQGVERWFVLELWWWWGGRSYLCMFEGVRDKDEKPGKETGRPRNWCRKRSNCYSLSCGMTI